MCVCVCAVCVLWVCCVCCVLALCACVYVFVCVCVYPIAGYAAVTDGYVSHGMVVKSMNVCVRVCEVFACVRVFVRFFVRVSMSECLCVYPNVGYGAVADVYLSDRLVLNSMDVWVWVCAECMCVCVCTCACVYPNAEYGAVADGYVSHRAAAHG